ncbi:hypothetical protein L9F63_007629 [Diploptera punctata]|uniref:Ionotropic glutamate receptor C-terminal domain-containing protein n=1 Tax=Diploptera punctata TaxID=6984 RepID=A0AAD7Z7I6_DIPPU|nr:hypothetical protein L9F63_007629 [Diploptera punctata]
MQGRELTISTFSWYFPYISMKYLDGTENKLIMELSKRLNFTYSFILNKVWGTFEPNGTGEGIHRDLLIGVSDIGLGGIFIVYNYYQYFDFTMPYLLNGITMLVPRPKPLALWLSITAPFNKYIWILVVGSVLIGSLSLYICANLIINQRDKSSENHEYTNFMYCLLTVIGQLTQAPANRWPLETSLRHLLTWQFIFFALVMTGYKSSLIHYLKARRYEKTIDNGEDFTNVPDLYWTAVDESWPKLLSSFTDPSLQKIYSRYKRYSNIEDINKSLHQGNLAIAVENLATGGYSGADYIDKDFIASSMWLMSCDLTNTMVAMELQKGLPYIEHFNAIIRRLIEAGIIRQWEVLSWLYTDLWRKKLDKITMTKFGWNKHIASEPPISMQASHFLGVFSLLCFGLSLSFIVFLIELRFPFRT